MTKQTKQYLKTFLDKQRLDRRRADEQRPLEIETGLIERAEGSAKVKLGNTEVLVGVKLDVGTPFPDSPDEGVIIVNAELSPIADPEFESGPPRENAIELARVVDRGIRESKSIELGKLCIDSGEKVWMVFMDIYILNNEGNLVDAAGIATIAALLNARLPKLDKDGNIDRDAEPDGKLPVVQKPIPVTVGKINSTLLADPTEKEEEVIETKLTVTTLENGNVCAMQKSGSGTITASDLEYAFELSRKTGKEIRKKLN